eukprot:gene15170-49683_t
MLPVLMQQVQQQQPRSPHTLPRPHAAPSHTMAVARAMALLAVVAAAGGMGGGNMCWGCGTGCVDCDWLNGAMPAKCESTSAQHARAPAVVQQAPYMRHNDNDKLYSTAA